MQWSEVIKPPSSKTLRQFAGLFLVFFLGLAAWRWFTGRQDTWALGMGIAAVVVGLAGMAVPALVRPIYTGWMIAAFPIGWTVSRLILGAVFFLVVTPIGLVFRTIGRDALGLRRRQASTYWMTKAQSGSSADYLRQS
jgi:hypothetical protein